MISWLSSVPSPSNPAPESVWLWVRVVAFLGLLAAGAYFLSVFTKKKRLSSNTSSKGKIFIADTCPLGNRQYLVVAQYGSEKHLLGINANSMIHLSKLQSDSIEKEKSEKVLPDEN